MLLLVQLEYGVIMTGAIPVFGEFGLAFATCEDTLEITWAMLNGILDG